ncbi:hypothetical protein JOF53_007842 [Crossiella equi]|uniref:Uncharacterized protein n=1 Tax=Crossiella equi TaxID=130796 RepID=A0ABS5AQZ1_9PSEU|nr:hypothetical protein [Crossiella equi]MBP2478970.1 hypothetical protein [Crossiella equi]
MSVEARLQLKASIWGKSDNRIAVLLAEGRSAPRADGDNLLLRAALSAGMRHISHVERLALPTLMNWSVSMTGNGLLSARFPLGRILFEHVPLNLPDAWRWAAKRTGLVVLCIGAGLGLAGGARLEDAINRGDLVGGAVAFHDEAAAA